MAHERVYHPETCEPFDVPPAKAVDLRLNKGWSSTPWKKVDPEPAPEPAVQETARWRTRGRKRFVAPAEEEVIADISEPEIEVYFPEEDGDA